MKNNDKYLSVSRSAKKLNIRAALFNSLIDHNQIKLPVITIGAYKYITIKELNKWIDEEINIFIEKFDPFKIDSPTEIVTVSELLEFMQMSYYAFITLNDLGDNQLRNQAKTGKRRLYRKTDIKDWIEKNVYDLMTREPYWSAYLRNKPVLSSPLPIALATPVPKKDTIDDLIEIITKSDVIKNEMRRILSAIV